MTKDEALKLALEALEKAITAIKEALAQPEQEPVAECVDDGEGGIYYRTIKKHIGLLYTTPPQPEQEPVARYFEDYQGQPIEEIDEERFNQTPDECRFKLYTAPPQPEPVIDKSAATRIATALGWEPKRKPLPPQSPCEMTQAERKMFKLGWLECEAAHGIKE